MTVRIQLWSFILILSILKLQDVLLAPTDIGESDVKLFEDDIANFGFDPTIPQTRTKLNDYVNKGIIDEKMRWPNGIIPYMYNDGFNDKQIKMISKAMRGICQVTCIKFVMRVAENDYLQIIPSKQCYSSIGRIKGPQTIGLYISGDIENGVIQHTLLHAIGLYHEQARSDRDQFVQINMDNIAEEDKSNFLTYNDQTIPSFGEDYDFGSVMHYGKYAFANNKDDWTIKPLEQYQEFEKDMGQRKGLSDKDAMKVNTIYECNAPQSPRPSKSIVRTTAEPRTTTTTDDGPDDTQLSVVEHTVPTTTEPPKATKSRPRKATTPVIQQEPDDTDDGQQTPAPASITRIIGGKGARNFWWTGPNPPDFYKPPQNSQEFYPWKTNGLMTFNGEQRIVSSGFRDGLHPNGTHWRTNWYSWKYPDA